MTIKDLIEKLQSYKDEDLEVIVNGKYNIDFVELKNSHNISLVTYRALFNLEEIQNSVDTINHALEDACWAISNIEDNLMELEG